MGLFKFAKTMIKDVKKISKKVKKSPAKGKKTTRKKAVKKSAKKGQKKAIKKTKKLPRKKIQKKKPSKKVKRPTKGAKEKEIGVITHYFGKISVGIIKLKAGLKVGDKIHIKGAHDDFLQVIKSMQLNHKDITRASKGNEIGIKVKLPVHENDRVYRVKDKG